MKECTKWATIILKSDQSWFLSFPRVSDILLNSSRLSSRLFIMSTSLAWKIVMYTFVVVGPVQYNSACQSASISAYTGMDLWLNSWKVIYFLNHLSSQHAHLFPFPQCFFVPLVSPFPASRVITFCLVKKAEIAVYWREVNFLSRIAFPLHRIIYTRVRHLRRTAMLFLLPLELRCHWF